MSSDLLQAHLRRHQKRNPLLFGASVGDRISPDTTLSQHHGWSAARAGPDGDSSLMEDDFGQSQFLFPFPDEAFFGHLDVLYPDLAEDLELMPVCTPQSAQRRRNV